MNGIEIERKYIIEHPGDDWLISQPGSRKIEIIQTYLTSGTGETRRIRKWDENGKESYFKTTKRFISAITREENEEEISRDEYDSLKQDANQCLSPIEKTRWRIPYEGHTLEIDHYVSWWNDRSILEIELNSEEEAFSVPPELHIIREVTMDMRYRNSSMAKEMPPRD